MTRRRCAASACGKFAEDQCAPCESPHLVGVGERDAASDAEVLGCELLKEVADDPDESAKKEPEEQRSRFAGVKDGGLRSAVEREDECEHRAQFADVKTVTKESGFMPLM